ncbi:hypothetical protein [Pseudoruegeria sp. HB172150]|uniref:hypothetical protein n=1 Tax=Pseudoruegeria sp. HB172150 TaxID=2721164 RepID=UPI001554DF70|nr:hypothetical protein [Pseudoruegeria sp. HB172150]
MRLLASILLAVTVPACVLAEDVMSGAEFEAYVEGRTLTYHDQGVAYGIEQYLPGRRVRWAYIGDECWDGYWYEDTQSNICFVYEDNPEPKCWRFTRREGRISALFMGTDEGRELYEVMNSPEPLTCMGPDVGV